MKRFIAERSTTFARICVLSGLALTAGAQWLTLPPYAVVVLGSVLIAFTLVVFSAQGRFASGEEVRAAETPVGVFVARKSAAERHDRERSEATLAEPQKHSSRRGATQQIAFRFHVGGTSKTFEIEEPGVVRESEPEEWPVADTDWRVVRSSSVH